jgi:vesicle coat complex subunit
VKLFLSKPGSAQELVQNVLQAATQGCENPDIRDRAYIYWRLLSSNPQAAKVCLALSISIFEIQILKIQTF